MSLNFLRKLLDWLLSNDCPYCKVPLEPTWTTSYLCPLCGYDNMTGRRLLNEAKKQP